ncbi:MAG: hypothetical protein LBS81_06230 [Endomicrobium sp.]|jgi:hypothetical protein|nr:hypothetical protein [Endomicrobium sp.]
MFGQKNESKILEAETFYKKFENAFKAGNFKDTKKYFNLFLEEIGNIEIAPVYTFFLYENMRDMITNSKAYIAFILPTTEIIQFQWQLKIILL